MTVREVSRWQDVSKADNTLPYFRNRFLKAKPGAKSDGSLFFTAPKKPIEFVLVINRGQWIKFEQFEETTGEDKSEGIFTSVPSTQFVSPFKILDTNNCLTHNIRLGRVLLHPTCLPKSLQNGRLLLALANQMYLPLNGRKYQCLRFLHPLNKHSTLSKRYVTIMVI